MFGSGHLYPEQYDLIDGFRPFVNPMIVGEGIPLFTGTQEKIKLKLLPESRQFKCGAKKLNYLVDRD